MSSPTIYDYNQCKLRTVSAVCGSGKTNALIKRLKEQQSITNQLVVLPSINMVNQLYSDLNNLGLKQVKRITSDTHRYQVKSQVVKYLNNDCFEWGHILIITWQAYDDLPYFENKDNWGIYIEELPQIDSYFELDVAKNRQFITDFIELNKQINSKISSIKIKDGMRHELSQIVASSDDGYKSFMGLYRAVLSPNRDIFVDIEKWNEVLIKYKKGESTSLSFLAMLNPRQFSGVTILAAHIEQSILYHWFTTFHKTKLEPHHDLRAKLKFVEHDQSLGDRTSISYFITERHYSKSLRDRDKGHSVLGVEMDELAKKQFGDSPFLYVLNNDHSLDIATCPRRLD